MISFQESMNEYKKQLEKGAIQIAYRGLMNYFNFLKVYFKKKYPTYSVSGSIYFGYMDMTYFAFFPQSLKRRKLKVGIVFLHEAFRFEVWLFGYNKEIQKRYWNLIKENDWNKYRIPLNLKGVDSILEHTIVGNPDFSDLDALTKQMEKGTLEFIEDIENFLNHLN
jgi:hypothetical protein